MAAANPHVLITSGSELPDATKAAKTPVPRSLNKTTRITEARSGTGQLPMA